MRLRNSLILAVGLTQACSLDWTKDRESTDADTGAGDGGPDLSILDGGEVPLDDSGLGPHPTLDSGGCAMGLELKSDTCFDINECATDNGGCAQRCDNSDGSFSCRCDPGFALATDKTTCAPFNWGEPKLLEIRDDGDARVIQVVTDKQGNATAAWTLTNCCMGNVWANRFEPAAGWRGAQRIETSSDLTRYPRLAVDGQGNVLAVWERYIDSGATPSEVWANKFSAGASWGTPVRIASSAGQPSIAMDASGSGAAIFAQLGTSRTQAASARHTPSAGWSSTEKVENDPATTGLRNYEVAMGANGEVFAVWQRTSPAPSMIQSSRFVPGSGWQGPVSLSIGTENVGEYAHVVGSDKGPIVATWGQNEHGQFSGWARVFSGKGWDTPVLLESDDTTSIVGVPAVASDDSGSAIAVWARQPASPDDMTATIWAARYANGAWEAATPVGGLKGGSPQIAMDGAGNAVAIWSAGDAAGRGSDIWASRFSARTGSWSPAELVEHNNFGRAFYPGIAMDPAGHAFAVWQQLTDGHWNAWAVRLEPCTEADGACSQEPELCGLTASADCVCAAGYKKSGNSNDCVDIDECANNTDGCDASPDACVNTAGGFFCACPASYIGNGYGADGCTYLDPWS